MLKSPPTGQNLMIMGMCPQSYWHLRIDNVNPSVTTPSTNQRIMCKLISYPATSLFHLAFKNVLLKPFREFEIFSAVAVLDSPSGAYNKLHTSFTRAQCQ